MGTIKIMKTVAVNSVVDANNSTTGVIDYAPFQPAPLLKSVKCFNVVKPSSLAAGNKKSHKCVNSKSRIARINKSLDSLKNHQGLTIDEVLVKLRH